MSVQDWDNADHDSVAKADRYIVSEQDRRIVGAAKDLLWKIVRSQVVTAKDLIGVAKVLNVLERLPRRTERTSARVSLAGPERWYGEHKIQHWWEVEVRPDEITIMSGGYFYQKSTGGDSFTCLQWFAQPRLEANYVDCWDRHHILDDAQPFEAEVAAIDMAGERYSLTVDDDSDESENDEEVSTEEEIASKKVRDTN